MENKTPILEITKLLIFFRVVIVSSIAHEPGSINWDDIHFQKTPGSYNKVTAYNQSKLANVLHAAELARRVEKFGIKVFSLHPGKSQYYVPISVFILNHNG